MTPNGLSDSVAGLTEQAPSCPVCGTEARIDGDSCVSCLLRAGLGEEADASAQDFDDALREINVRDTDWRLGNYQILEEVGRGGMGLIYRARQRHSKRIVALKRVLSYHGDSRETLERFRREAEAAASLDHPNILPIYEVSEAEGLPFFTMKYATGGSLQQAAPALSVEPRECVRLLAKITRAVAYAHGEGILHRDLKPGNILLDGRSEPLVSDFGLAKWIDASSDLTRSLTIFGTPGYIAPEQAEGPAAALTPTADVYSLGAILFDLLTGRPPFLGEHALAVIREAAEKPAPKLRTVMRHADRDLETICAKCLEREPRARYRTASDLAEDLERWLEGRPILARPVLPPAQAWRWARRNPVLAGSVAVCLLLATLVGARQVQSRRLSAEVLRSQMAAHSVAVLPLLNLDTLESDPHLADTIAGALSHHFSGLGPAQVTRVQSEKLSAAAAGSQEVREVGTTLGTRSVLAGTVRAINGKIRIGLRLLNASTGDLLLVRLYEAPDPETAAAGAASSMARPSYAALDAHEFVPATAESNDPGMRNPQIRELIIAGQELKLRMNVPDLDRAITCFEKALALEPNSAVAHAHLASAAGMRTHFVADKRFLELAEYHASEASRLAPDSADARLTLAGLNFRKGRIAQALSEALTAVEAAGPQERLSVMIAASLNTLGQPRRALAWWRTAQIGRARPGEYDTSIGDCLARLGLDEEAKTAYRRAADLHPEMPHGLLGLCHLALLNGRIEEARSLLAELRAQFPGAVETAQISALTAFISRDFPKAEIEYQALVAGDSEGGDSFYGAVTYDTALGYLQLSRGREDGVALLRRAQSRIRPILAVAPDDPDTWYRLAAIASALGEKDAALDAFEKAVAAGCLSYRSAALDPRFDNIRSEPRFRSLLSRLIAKAAMLRREIKTDLEPTTEPNP